LNAFRIIKFLETDVKELEQEWDAICISYDGIVEEAINGILALKKFVPNKVHMLLFTGES